MLRRALRLRITRVAMIIAGLVGIALSLSPLLGVHGPESALVLAVVLPPFAGAIGARLVIDVRRRGIGPDPGTLVGSGVVASLIVLAVPVAVLGLNALRVRTCTPLEGLAFIALGPGFGVAFASIVGSTAATFIRGNRLATVTGVLMPFFFVGLAIHRFWASPAIFLYGHYFGFFPGTIYDEDVVIPLPYLTFRMATLALAGGLTALVAATLDPASVRAKLHRAPRKPLLAFGSIALIGAAIAAELWGHPLGHHGSAEWIVEKLGGRAEGRRCTVIGPRETDVPELRRLAQDCDFRVEQAERILGVRQRARVTAYFFRNTEEKRGLMGAASTFIAKPWRNEVYLQYRPWPHPVLAHEIAHVVVGNAARGPFRVAGRAGGWLPDPSIIEGVAVAVAWTGRDDLNPHQWARAMIELGVAPPLESVAGTSFLFEHARRAYTLSGSFYRWVLETHGAEKLRRIYATADVEAVLGKDIDELERDWLAFLATVPLPDDAMALARVHFSGRSIFSQVCAHRVAALQLELGQDLMVGDPRRTARTCRKILDIDPTDGWTRATLVAALARLGDERGARRNLSMLEGPPPAPVPMIVAAREGIADAAWREGRTERALRMYRALLGAPQSEDDARVLEVKAIALEAGGREAELIFELLVGADGRPADAATAVHLARELREVRPDGLAPYLEARQLVNMERFDRAIPLLRLARARGLPTQRLSHEARRLLGTALFARWQLDASAAIWREAERDPTSAVAEADQAREWLVRIRDARRWPRASARTTARIE